MDFLEEVTFNSGFERPALYSPPELLPDNHGNCLLYHPRKIQGREKMG
jgi:hypothetical protein